MHHPAQTKHTPPVWIVGDAVDGTRTYLVRTAAPRFIARIADEDDDAAALADFSFTLLDGRSLTDFHWMDAAPRGGKLVALLNLAATAIRDYDEFTDWTDDEEDL